MLANVLYKMRYLLIAFGIAWITLLVYIVYLLKRKTRLAKEIEVLRGEKEK